MEWISVKDQLPEKGKAYHTKYLIVVTWLDTFLDNKWKSYVECAYFNQFHKTWLSDNETLIVNDEDTIVTHWMPLPEPPIE